MAARSRCGALSTEFIVLCEESQRDALREALDQEPHLRTSVYFCESYAVIQVGNQRRDVRDAVTGCVESQGLKVLAERPERFVQMDFFIASFRSRVQLTDEINILTCWIPSIIIPTNNTLL